MTPGEERPEPVVSVWGFSPRYERTPVLLPLPQRERQGASGTSCLLPPYLPYRSLLVPIGNIGNGTPPLECRQRPILRGRSGQMCGETRTDVWGNPDRCVGKSGQMCGENPVSRGEVRPSSPGAGGPPPGRGILQVIQILPDILLDGVGDLNRCVGDSDRCVLKNELLHCNIVIIDPDSEGIRVIEETSTPYKSES